MTADELEPLEIDLLNPHHLLISGSNLLRCLLRQAKALPGARVLLWSGSGELDGLPEGVELLQSGEAADQFFAWLAQELTRRQAERKEGAQTAPPPIYLLIDGYRAFFDAVSQQTISRLRALLLAGAGLGVSVAAAGGADALASLASFMEPVTLLLAKGPCVLLGGKPLDHQAVETGLSPAEKNQPLKEWEGLYCGDGGVRLFRAMDARGA